MAMNNLPRLWHCVFDLKLHLVLVTKYRRRCLCTLMVRSLSDIFIELARRWDSQLIEFGAEADHVHLLLAVNPKIQPSKLVNNFKTVSSRRLWAEHQRHLRQTYCRSGTLWSRSYFVSSVGGAPLEVLKRYVQNQDAPG
jgi:putative transposase